MTVHRGSDEIGGTCIQIDSSTNTILLDIGLPLSSLDEEDSPIIKYDLPNLPNKIDGVIISHYHKDHWGLAGLLKEETPLYLPGKSKEILIKQQKLIGKEKSKFLDKAISFSPGETLQIGNIRIKTHLVDHSAMDACAFEIESDGERIVYTGDFRNHGRKGILWKKFIRDVAKPVDKLICEGTMLSRKESKVPTEGDLEKHAVEILKQHKEGLALGWCSTVNFDRITTFYRAAKRTGRIFAVDIYTAYMMQTAAKDNRLPDPKQFNDIQVFYPPGISKMIKKSAGVEALYPFARKKLAREEANLNPGKYLLLVRPSSDYSWLDTISHWDNSVLFYSQWSGYRKDPKNCEFLKKLEQRGCRDVTLHTSGHADIVTLKKTIETLQPKEIIPVHTEMPEWFGNKGEFK